MTRHISFSVLINASEKLSRITSRGNQATKFFNNLLSNFIQIVGLFEKWSTLDPKYFYVIPFQKLVFLISLYPEFLEKNQRNKIKS